MGQSVSFRDAAHTPSDEKQKEEWEKKYHWEEPHLWDYPMLPDEDDGGVVREVPQAAGLHAEGRHAEHRVRDLRARRLLRVPQDEGLRHEHPEARADPDEDRLEADAGLGEELDPQSARGEADDVDAALLVQLEQQLARRRGRATKSRSTRSSAYLFANAEKHEFAVKNPPRGDAKSGEQIVKSIGCQGCHVVGEGKREEVGPRRTFGQPLENIGNKTTYEWIYNWVRDPKHYSPATYMPNLRLTDRAGGRRRDVSRRR